MDARLRGRDVSGWNDARATNCNVIAAQAAIHARFVHHKPLLLFAAQSSCPRVPAALKERASPPFLPACEKSMRLPCDGGSTLYIDRPVGECLFSAGIRPGDRKPARHDEAVKGLA